MKLMSIPRVFFQVKLKSSDWINISYRRTMNLTKRQLEIVIEKMKKDLQYYINNAEYRFIVVLEEEK